MHTVEQLDLFNYIDEMALSEASNRPENTSSLVDMVPSVIDLDNKNVISRFKNALGCALRKLPNPFGLLQWVNVYTVTRAYGGKEEGGWYYRRFNCEETHAVWFWDAEWLQLKLKYRFSGLAWGNISPDSVGQEVTVLIERRRAAQQTVSIPPYESKYVISHKQEDYFVGGSPKTNLHVM